MSDKIVRKGKIDYSEISDELKEIISEPFSEVIEKTVNISFDGKQFLCRFPKDISNAIGIKKGDKIEIKVKLFHPEIQEKEKIEITYMRGE